MWRTSLLRKAVTALVFSGVLCAVASAQPNKVNPFTGIAWPANCNASGTVAYNFLSNTCFPAGSSTAAIVYKGTWSGSTSYVKSSSEVDAVFYAGSQWVTLINANLNHQPDTSPSQWALLISGTPGVPSINGLTTPFVLSTGATCTTVSGTTTCTFPGGLPSGCSSAGSGNLTCATFTTTGGSFSGFVGLQQGPAPTVAANTIEIYAPTSVTGYRIAFPGTAPTTGNPCPAFPNGGGVASWQPCGGYFAGSVGAVTVSGAAPTAGQVLTATSGVAADWETGGGGDCTNNCTFTGTTTTGTIHTGELLASTTGTPAGGFIANIANVVFTLQNTNATGFAGLAGYDDLSAQQIQFGYANLSSSVLAGDVLMQSTGSPLCLGTAITRCDQLFNGSGTSSFRLGVVAPNLPLANTATITAGAGVSAVGCSSATCTSARGIVEVVGGTATTGTIASLSWSATPTAYVCAATQNGGANSIGNLVPTTTGFDIIANTTVFGLTIFINYSCTP